MNTVRILPKLLLLGTTLVLVVSLGCTSGGPNGMHGQTRVTPPATERRPVYVQRSSTMGEGVVPSSPTRFESDSTTRAAASSTAQTSSQAYRTGGWTPVTPEEKGTSVASQPGAIEHTAHYPDMNDAMMDDDSSVEDLDSLEPFDKPKTPRADATAPSAPTVAPIPAEASQPVPQRTLHWMPTSASSEAVHAAVAPSGSASSGSHSSVSPEEVPLKRTFFTHLFSNVSMKPEDPAFDLEAPPISVKRPVSKDEEELERAKAKIAAHFTDDTTEAVAAAPSRTANTSLEATSASFSTAKNRETQSGWHILTPAQPNPAYGSAVTPPAASAPAAEPASASTPAQSTAPTSESPAELDADDPGIVDLDSLPPAR